MKSQAAKKEKKKAAEEEAGGDVGSASAAAEARIPESAFPSRTVGVLSSKDDDKDDEVLSLIALLVQKYKYWRVGEELQAEGRSKAKNKKNQNFGFQEAEGPKVLSLLATSVWGLQLLVYAALATVEATSV